MNKKTRLKLVLYSTRMEIEKIVKVKAYERIRNGKIEKVRSHFRRY